MSKWQALRCLCGLHDWTRWRKVFQPLWPVGNGTARWDTETQRRFCRACGTAQARPWRGRKRRSGLDVAAPPYRDTQEPQAPREGR